MKNKIKFGLLIVTVGLVLLVSQYDNTDQQFSIEDEQTQTRHIFLSDRQINLKNEVNSNEEQNVRLLEQIGKNYEKYPPNYCTNGKDFTKLTRREHLMEFIRGPCSPLIVIPGHQGTSLRMQIDCEQLLKYQPEIFESCGWGTCDWSLFRYRPAAEYTVWVPDINSPMSLFARSVKSSKCLGLLNALKTEKNQNGDIYIQAPRGINVTWFGNTPGSKSFSECGLKSIYNLMPVPFYQPASCKEFYDLWNTLKRLGYVNGFSFQALPYDFRNYLLLNEAKTSYQTAIEFLFRVTGKKVLVVAHSMGNLLTLNILNSMNQTTKDHMIKHWVSLAPPFLGSVKALKIFIGGNQDYLFPFGLGLQFIGQKLFIEHQPSAYELLPKFVFNQFKQEPWFKEALTRSRLEERKASRETWEEFQQNSLFPYIPSPLQNCSTGFLFRNDTCQLGVYDQSTKPLAIINSQVFYYDDENLKELINDHSLVTNKKNEDIEFQQVKKTGIHNLENPGVEISLLHYSHVPTEVMLLYQREPRFNTLKGEFAFPDATINTMGDGVVSRDDILIPGLKWSWEYQNQQQNTKSVKIVDVCSNFNRDENRKKLGLNEYFGIDCDCKPELHGKTTTDGANCYHSTIINDSYVIKYILDIGDLEDNHVDPENTLAAKLDEQHFTVFYEECYVLTNQAKVKDLFNTHSINPLLF